MIIQASEGADSRRKNKKSGKRKGGAEAHNPNKPEARLASARGGCTGANSETEKRSSFGITANCGKDCQ